MSLRRAIALARRNGFAVGTGLRIAITVFTAATLAFAASITVLALDNSAQRDRDQATIERERKIRREALDQFCLLAERQHREDVRQLRRTYKFLVQLTPEERSQTINRFIIRLLPQTERAAVTDAAPPLCDKPGRGLPEPDPKLPKRPHLPFAPPAIEGITEARSTPSEPSSGDLTPAPQRPTTRPPQRERPAQRPDVKPQPPARPSPAKPRPEPPSPDLTEPPKPPDVVKPPVCVTVPPPVAVPPVCLP